MTMMSSSEMERTAAAALVDLADEYYTAARDAYLSHGGNHDLFENWFVARMARHNNAKFKNLPPEVEAMKAMSFVEADRRSNGEATVQ